MNWSLTVDKAGKIEISNELFTMLLKRTKIRSRKKRIVNKVVKREILQMLVKAIKQ